jgi:hypothetical protein
MHSYITLKQQSLDKISLFGGFCEKLPSLACGVGEEGGISQIRRVARVAFQ